MVIVISLLAALFCNTPLFSQTNKSAEYRWTKPFKQDDTIFHKFSNEPALYFNKEISISLNDFNDNTIVSVKGTIKYLNAEGVSSYSTIKIPESYNKNFDYYDIANTDNKADRPKYYNLSVSHFAARILKPNGTVVNAIIKEKKEEEQPILGLRPLKAYTYSYQISNIEAGDVLEFDYAFYIGEMLWTNTYFFHEDLPIQILDFNFSYRAGSYLVKNYINHEGPIDSAGVINKLTGMKTLSWKWKNMHGLHDEVQSRYYVDLPGFTYYEHAKDYGNTDDKGNITNYLPYSWGFVLYKYYNYGNKWLFNDNRLEWMSRTDKNSSAIKKYFNKAVTYQKSHSFIDSLLNLQKHVNDSLLYYDDYDYIIGKNNDLENEHFYLEKNNTIRWRSRTNLYDKFLDLLKADYFNVIVLDKRTNKINQDYVFTLPTTHTHSNIYYQTVYSYYGINIKNHLFYVYPKNHRYGLHVNEFPFYLENTTAIAASASRMMEEKDNFIFVNTPYSTINDNYRIVNSKCKVSTTDKNVTFSSTVTLSGQFSTIQRGHYLYDHIDPLINKNYYKKLFNISSNTTVYKNNLVYSNDTFPYKSQFNFEYNDNSILKISSDTISLDVSKLFPFVNISGFKYTNRYLPFYNDFVFQDEIKYVIEFDNDVRLLNFNDIIIDISNETGVFKVLAEMTKPNTLYIRAVYKIAKEKVNPNSIGDIENIYKAVDKLNDATLHFTRKI